MHIREIRYRLREDFRLAVISSLSVVTMLGFTPFFIYRVIRAEWAAAALDFSILVSIAVTLFYTWYSGDTQRPSKILMYLLCGASYTGVRLLGPVVLPWMYPMLVSNFFLVNRRHAAGVALGYLLILCLDGHAFPTPLIGGTFIVTTLLTCFYSYIFAYRSEIQRLQLENLATRDALTGMFNRRAFQEELLRAHQAFEREQTICGLLVLDIDHFKQINDTWGHDAGDEVLVRLANLIEHSVRKTDRFFRFGGEEFVLLVSPTQISALRTMAENLCNQVAQDLIYRDRPLTISIGGALLKPTESPGRWFARADAALYRAKKQGRNQAVIDLCEA
jgi:diguanylate cyclase (GGDEF)-like protein